MAKKVMLKEGFNEEKLIPIYNSLNHQAQVSIRENLNSTDVYSNYFKNDTPVLIYVGRIQKSKKLDLLILALKCLKDQGYICNLAIVGAHVEGYDIRELVLEKNLNQQVWFYGPTYDEKVIANLFYNADVCVSPGPVGLTALHAFTYGCPVISNDDFEAQMPEHEIIQSSINGEFFKNDNIQDMVRVIKKWICLDVYEKAYITSATYKIVDEKWNPHSQITAIKRALKV